jgi:hypothetical protein
VIDGLLEVSDVPVGRGELVFKANDAGGGGQRHVLIEQFTHPDSQSEISAAVAALPPAERPGVNNPAASRLRRKAGCTPSRSAAKPMV